MRESRNKYVASVIPSRLHTRGRKAVAIFTNDDRLYIRHEPIADNSGYGMSIPGHAHLENQSANSHSLNKVNGYACDVLYDTKNGKHHFDHDIACITLEDIQELSLPNHNTIVKDRNGEITKTADVYSFLIKHDPAPLMYPHCIIEAQKNGKRTSKISKGFKTTLRSKFAELAEKNREETRSVREREYEKWKREYDKLISQSTLCKLALSMKNFFVRLFLKSENT